MKKQKYSKQFTQVPFGLYRDFKLYEILRECLPIYTYLQTCVYRKVHGKDKFNLYEKYYMQGILAVSVTQKEIAKRHGHGRNKVIEILNLLEKHDFIKVEKIKTKYKKKGKWIIGEQNVYILGKHFLGNPAYLARDIDFYDDTFDGGSKAGVLPQTD